MRPLSNQQVLWMCLSRGTEPYLDIQGTQNNGPYAHCFGIEVIILGTLQVQVPSTNTKSITSNTCSLGNAGGDASPRGTAGESAVWLGCASGMHRGIWRLMLLATDHVESAI